MIKIIHNIHPSHHHHHPPPSAALVLNQVPSIRPWVCDSLASNISMKCFQEESRREWESRWKQGKSWAWVWFQASASPWLHRAFWSTHCLTLRQGAGPSHSHMVSHLLPAISGQMGTPRHVWPSCCDPSNPSGLRASCEEGHCCQPGSKVKGDWVMGSQNW